MTKGVKLTPGHGKSLGFMAIYGSSNSQNISKYGYHRLSTHDFLDELRHLDRKNFPSEPLLHQGIRGLRFQVRKELRRPIGAEGSKGSRGLGKNTKQDYIRSFFLQ